MSKTLMTKEDGHRLELKMEQLELKIEQFKSEIIKWFFGMLISQALVVLGGVFFLVSHSKATSI